MTARDAAPHDWITSLSTADLEALTAEYQEASDRLYEDGYEAGKADAGGFTLASGLIWAAAGATLPTVVLSLLRAEEVARVLVRWGCL